MASLRILLATVFLANLLWSSEGIAQNFSCTFGRGACLNYGDTVCSSNGKCVDSSAICFEAYQCGYGGFTCKSDVEECISDYNNLLNKNNELVAGYNELLERNNGLVDDYNELLGSAKRLSENLEYVEGEVTDLKLCVQTASTIAEAQSCFY